MTCLERAFILQLVTYLLLQNPIGKNASVKKEELQGKALIDGALANNVKHFVYSSVDRGGNDFSYETRTDIPHFISKYHIEHHLVESAKGKMNWTILRPVTFMEVCCLSDSYQYSLTSFFRFSLLASSEKLWQQVGN